MNNNFYPYLNSEPNLPEFDLKSNKKKITYVCLFLFMLTALSTLMQYVSVYVIIEYFNSFASTYWYIWFLSLLPLYCFALPLSLIVLSNVKKKKIEPDVKKYKFTQILGFLGIAIFFLYIGNFIGITVTNIISVITGQEITNTVAEVIDSSPIWLTIIVTVILAPIGEEFMFRKLLIDRLNIYGQKFAILFSAIAFGLFHGNFNQFFYAAALGLVFGYVYSKTGKLRYSIILHAAINFFGGTVSEYIFKNIDIEAMENLAGGTMEEMTQYLSAHIIPLIVLVIYGIVMFSLFVTGIVYFSINLKKIALKKGEVQIPKQEVGNCVFYNAGAIMFFIVIAFLFVTSCMG